MNSIDLLVKAGAVAVVLIVFSVVAFYVIVEKCYQFHRDRISVKEIVTGLVNVLKRDGIAEAISLCDATPGPVAALLRAAIQAYQSDDDIRLAVENSATESLPRLENHLNILSTITYTAPLVGLLGTVVGMMSAFSTIQQGGVSVTMASLAGGISLALGSAAGGLAIAIPCHIAYNYLVTRVQNYCHDMEKASAEILYFFNHHEKPKAGKKA